MWHGLKQAIECLREGDLADAQGILDAMSVTLPTGQLDEGAYDENGNLYKIPQAVISDPSDIIEDMNDGDAETVTSTSGLDIITAKLEAADGTKSSESKADSLEEKSRAAKGKTAVRDAVKVKCRLSDRGSPECDVTVVLGRSEKVALLASRIEVERDVSQQLPPGFFLFQLILWYRFPAKRNYDLPILARCWTIHRSWKSKVGKREISSRFWW